MTNKKNSSKRKTLPKRWVQGGLDRLNRTVPEVAALFAGAAQIIEDCGGEETAGLLKQRMAHRIMHLDLMLMRDELKNAAGQDFDRTDYLAAAETYRRFALALGLDRVPRKVQTLAEYAAQLRDEQAPK